ncbi:hypothetical protein JCM5350_000314 [Sporobolomyces pararoseus]
MPLFEWHHRRTQSSAAAPPTRHPNGRREIPTLTIQVEDHSAVPFPSSRAQDAAQSSSTNFLSKLRRVASCLSFSSSSHSSSCATPRTTPTLSTTPQSHKRTPSLSIRTSPIDLKKGRRKSELKSFISYPTLRSSSSPISPEPSSIGGARWGVRKSVILEEEGEEQRHSIRSSLYGGFEELLDLSLCPPHLFPEDSQELEGDDHRHSKGRPSTGSEDSVSLSIFDDQTLLFQSPHSTTTYYPHQPTVVSHFSPSTTRARSRSTTLSTTRSLDEEQEEFEGFSWCPTPPTSVFNTPARSIVFTLDDDGENETEEQQQSPPTTPKLSGIQLEASPSSFLALPPPR